MTPQNIKERLSVERCFVYFGLFVYLVSATHELFCRSSGKPTLRPSTEHAPLSSVLFRWRRHHSILFWRILDFKSYFFAAALPEYPRLRNILRIVFSQTVSSAGKLLSSTRSLSGLTKGSFFSHRTINLSPRWLILRVLLVGFRGAIFDITIVSHPRGRSNFWAKLCCSFLKSFCNLTMDNNFC